MMDRGRTNYRRNNDVNIYRDGNIKNESPDDHQFWANIESQYFSNFDKRLISAFEDHIRCTDYICNKIKKKKINKKLFQNINCYKSSVKIKLNQNEKNISNISDYFSQNKNLIFRNIEDSKNEISKFFQRDIKNERIKKEQIIDDINSYNTNELQKNIKNDKPIIFDEKKSIIEFMPMAKNELLLNTLHHINLRNQQKNYKFSMNKDSNFFGINNNENFLLKNRYVNSNIFENSENFKDSNFNNMEYFDYLNNTNNFKNNFMNICDINNSDNINNIKYYNFFNDNLNDNTFMSYNVLNDSYKNFDNNSPKLKSIDNAHSNIDTTNNVDTNKEQKNNKICSSEFNESNNTENKLGGDSNNNANELNSNKNKISSNITDVNNDINIFNDNPNLFSYNVSNLKNDSNIFNNESNIISKPNKEVNSINVDNANIMNSEIEENIKNQFSCNLNNLYGANNNYEGMNNDVNSFNSTYNLFNNCYNNSFNKVHISNNYITVKNDLDNKLNDDINVNVNSMNDLNNLYSNKMVNLDQYNSTNKINNIYKSSNLCDKNMINMENYYTNDFSYNNNVFLDKNACDKYSQKYFMHNPISLNSACNDYKNGLFDKQLTTHNYIYNRKSYPNFNEVHSYENILDDNDCILKNDKINMKRNNDIKIKKNNTNDENIKYHIDKYKKLNKNSKQDNNFFNPFLNKKYDGVGKLPYIQNKPIPNGLHISIYIPKTYNFKKKNEEKKKKSCNSEDIYEKEKLARLLTEITFGDKKNILNSKMSIEEKEKCYNSILDELKNYNSLPIILGNILPYWDKQKNKSHLYKIKNLNKNNEKSKYIHIKNLNKKLACKNSKEGKKHLMNDKIDNGKLKKKKREIIESEETIKNKKDNTHLNRCLDKLNLEKHNINNNSDNLELYNKKSEEVNEDKEDIVASKVETKELKKESEKIDYTNVENINEYEEKPTKIFNNIMINDITEENSKKELTKESFCDNTSNEKYINEEKKSYDINKCESNHKSITNVEPHIKNDTKDFYSNKEDDIKEEEVTNNNKIILINEYKNNDMKREQNITTENKKESLNNKKSILKKKSTFYKFHYLKHFKFTVPSNAIVPFNSSIFSLQKNQYKSNVYFEYVLTNINLDKYRRDILNVNYNNSNSITRKNHLYCINFNKNKNCKRKIIKRNTKISKLMKSLSLNNQMNLSNNKDINSCNNEMEKNILGNNILEGLNEDSIKNTNRNINVYEENMISDDENKNKENKNKVNNDILKDVLCLNNTENIYKTNIKNLRNIKSINKEICVLFSRYVYNIKEQKKIIKKLLDNIKNEKKKPYKYWYSIEDKMINFYINEYLKNKLNTKHTYTLSKQIVDLLKLRIIVNNSFQLPNSWTEKALCNICSLGEDWEENPIIFCDCCYTPMHFFCTGFKNIKNYNLVKKNSKKEDKSESETTNKNCEKVNHISKNKNINIIESLLSDNFINVNSFNNSFNTTTNSVKDTNTSLNNIESLKKSNINENTHQQFEYNNINVLLSNSNNEKENNSNNNMSSCKKESSQDVKNTKEVNHLSLNETNSNIEKEDFKYSKNETNYKSINNNKGEKNTNVLNNVNKNNLNNNMDKIKIQNKENSENGKNSEEEQWICPLCSYLRNQILFIEDSSAFKIIRLLSGPRKKKDIDFLVKSCNEFPCDNLLNDIKNELLSYNPPEEIIVNNISKCNYKYKSILLLFDIDKDVNHYKETYNLDIKDAHDFFENVVLKNTDKYKYKDFFNSIVINKIDDENKENKFLNENFKLFRQESYCVNEISEESEDNEEKVEDKKREGEEKYNKRKRDKKIFQSRASKKEEKKKKS